MARVSRRYKAEMRQRYLHLYAPEAIARLANPAPPRAKVQLPPRKRAAKGTLAYAIDAGEVEPHGAYRRVTPMDIQPAVFEAVRHGPPRRMSALEAAVYLRECAEKKGQRWPLA